VNEVEQAQAVSRSAELVARSPERVPRSAERVAELLARVNRDLTVSVTAAHAIGGVVVFVFLGFVLPAPLGFEHASGSVLIRNLGVLAIYGPAALIAGNVVGRRRFGPWLKWLQTGEPSPEAGRELALRYPLRQMVDLAVIWLIGALLFGVLNLFSSVQRASTVAIVVVMGGLVTCALSYLLTERLLRDITALSLAGQPPPRPVVPGVTVRMSLAAALGGGVPLIGLIVLVWHALADQPITGSRLATTVLFISIAGLVIGSLAVFFAARSVSDPLSTIRHALARVRGGDLSVTVPVYDGSEVGLLQAGFNDMVEGLRERERLNDLFGRHVGQEVARRALERGIELGGETRRIAVLFVDLIGSTSLAVRRPPTEVVTMLNRFFALVVEVVDAHDGWVNKFEGDAALCVFGAPVSSAAPAGAALAAARALSRRLEQELPEVRAGIGVSAGDAVAGNVGAAERFEYTVIGDPVNEAARLCELAKTTPARLLASERVVDLAPASEAGHWKLGDEVTLRGRDRPTRVASPAGPPESIDVRAASPATSA